MKNPRDFLSMFKSLTVPFLQVGNTNMQMSELVRKPQSQTGFLRFTSKVGPAQTEDK